MTSPFARNQALSQQTIEAYSRLNGSEQVNHRVEFYLAYLRDVAPEGLTVSHIPVEGDRSHGAVMREEIRLIMSSGILFMSGQVSLDPRPNELETYAGDDAYTKWLNGDFTVHDFKWHSFTGQDITINWRFFTGQDTTINFFSSDDSPWYKPDAQFHPIQNAEQVAAYLQQKRDGLA
ncbi:hypothetical protein HO173_003925 [Letharia columbiana]|uniref:Uncharacterized protein n=1 Tax=Letharia columbiana TaxID=112416 RepID=A0A8H6FZJ9_9LECA|nr:uncharacterized protein HO173_003925 [Letharia columbiana]KAF6237724.1 hypothetical protein HO173_003925 [Letharia columbiana]